MSETQKKNTVKSFIMTFLSFIGSTYTLVILSAFNGIRGALIGGESAALPWVCVLIVLGAHSIMEARIHIQKKHNDYLYNLALSDRKRIKQLQYGLSCAQVGSCTCCTKTPETEYHAKTCRYRIIQDIIYTAQKE